MLTELCLTRENLRRHKEALYCTPYSAEVRIRLNSTGLTLSRSHAVRSFPLVPVESRRVSTLNWTLWTNVVLGGGSEDAHQQPHGLSAVPKGPCAQDRLAQSFQVSDQSA